MERFENWAVPPGFDPRRLDGERLAGSSSCLLDLPGAPVTDMPHGELLRRLRTFASWGDRDIARTGHHAGFDSAPADPDMLGLLLAADVRDAGRATRTGNALVLNATCPLSPGPAEAAARAVCFGGALLPHPMTPVVMGPRGRPMLVSLRADAQNRLARAVSVVPRIVDGRVRLALRAVATIDASGEDGPALALPAGASQADVDAIGGLILIGSVLLAMIADVRIGLRRREAPSRFTAKLMRQGKPAPAPYWEIEAETALGLYSGKADDLNQYLARGRDFFASTKC